MSFVLNLLAFILIVFGIMFSIVLNNSRITNKSKLTVEIIKKTESLLNKLKVYSFISVILGIGILVAKFFA